MPLRIRSMVGIIPLFAVEILDENVLERLPGFKSVWNGSYAIEPTWPATSRIWTRAGTEIVSIPIHRSGYWRFLRGSV